MLRIRLNNTLKKMLGKKETPLSKEKQMKQIYPDFSEEDIDLILSIKEYTTTGPDRINAMIQAVRYVMKTNIPGAILECGVWRGGSMMVAAKVLMRMGEKRELYLYDTYEGMSKPDSVDVQFDGRPAMKDFGEKKKNEESSDWFCCSIDEVRRNMLSTGYDEKLIHFVKGKVEDTIPGIMPKEIAILRLDTDFFESTRHELVHLFPPLSIGGILIIDDYGHWKGSRKAVDEYIEKNNVRIMLNRIDYTGRIGVKIG